MKRRQSPRANISFMDEREMDCGNLDGKLRVDGLSDTTCGISHQSGRTLWITNLMRPRINDFTLRWGNDL